MVGLRISVKSQKQFDLLRILTLSLSIVLDENGIGAVRNLYNSVFDEYFMQLSTNAPALLKEKKDIFSLMEKYILKGELPRTLADFWYYHIIQDCILYCNNYEIYGEAFDRKLDRRFQVLGNYLASDLRNMVREEALAIENASLEYLDKGLELYWYTPNHEACQECEDRDGVRLRDIKDLSIHPNCKCSLIMM